MWPDPETSVSPSIPRSTDVASIRIIPPFDRSEWRIIRDLRNKSVLSGFSSVGGLWTALAGVFAVLFGSSILRVIFGAFYSEPARRPYLCLHSLH